MLSLGSRLIFKGGSTRLGRHRWFRLSSCLDLFIDAEGIVLDDVINGTLDFLLILSARELIGQAVKELVSLSATVNGKRFKLAQSLTQH